MMSELTNTKSRPSRRPTRSPATLHDILTAWQRGDLGTRHAMSLAGVDTIADLYGAARSSAVPIRKELLAREKAAADRATAAIRARLAQDQAARPVRP